MNKKYANVIVEISAKSLDRPFTYLVPEKYKNNIDIGSIVTIPFGNSNKEIKGYVVHFLEDIDFDKDKLKSIINVNDSVNVESELIRLAYWMKRRYLCTIQGALKSMIPSSKVINKRYEKIIKRKMSPETLESIIDNISDHERFTKRKDTIKYFLNHEQVTFNTLIKVTHTTQAILKNLENKGVIEIINKESYRNPFIIEQIKQTEKLTPNSQQKHAIALINQSINTKTSDIFLLHGITGSGKTEVYMQVIEKVLSEGKQAIVMIPEIALTPQTVNRFVGRFGEIVGVIHSKLSQGEKYDQWRKAKEGKIDIMIGPRSAIFAPFENLGIIIIDEEHETSYKSEMPPKYHAREVAIKRGSMTNSSIILGSATPLVETYYKALEGKYKLIELNEKATGNNQLDVEIVDMRNELVEGNKSIFSKSLIISINEALSRNEQIILFINRRGYSRFVSCRKCGYVVKCSSCDMPYTYHAKNERLICHYCGKSIKKIKECPSCGSKYIKEFGIGTQKVENYIQREFPHSKVLRMDLDTTVKKNSHEKILNQFDNHESDILIGTQMVAKGHHFDNVTVVGVIAADLSLYIDDFRASERTFQLVTQVTGRTGRGLKKGKAIIQTYSPDHYSIICAREQDYKKFYYNEIKFRKMMDYPPFSNMATLLITADNENKLIKDVYKIKDLIKQIIDEEQVIILGPSPASISKIKDVYRWRILLKSKEYHWLVKTIQQIYINVNKNSGFNYLTLHFDLNPMMSH